MYIAVSPTTCRKVFTKTSVIEMNLGSPKTSYKLSEKDWLLIECVDLNLVQTNGLRILSDSVMSNELVSFIVFVGGVNLF